MKNTERWNEECKKMEKKKINEWKIKEHNLSKKKKKSGKQWKYITKDKRMWIKDRRKNIERRIKE